MVQSGRHWLDRIAWRVRPDLVVCNSRFTASTFPFAGARVEHVYAPVERVNAPRRASVRRALQTPDSDIVITQVSRMERWKGQTVCIDAFSQLASRSGWTCWIVGGAQRPEERRYLAALQASVARLGLAHRFRFPGQRTDVPDLLAASDIFCQPNLEPEPFGISLVEALSAGLPVVTTGIGGAVEIVDERCGVLVPPGDSGVLASALAGLLEDGALRKRLGHEGIHRASSLCDPAVQMPRIAQLLESACGSPF
jgi:glycosyltransferase involved in cell wall biosynthesis